MPYNTINYMRDVAIPVEQAESMRLRNQLARQQQAPDSVQNQLAREQLSGQQQRNAFALNQENRAQTQFTEEQRLANTKDLYQSMVEISQNPASASRHIPRLQQKGLIPAEFDYRTKTPEQLQVKATQEAKALGAALSPITKPSAPSSAAKDYSLALKQGYKGSFVDYQKELKKAGATTVNLGLTKGQEAVDKDYAKEYVDFKASGGYADIDKQIDQLAEVQDKLSSGAELTGPVTGNVPDLILNAINPEARAARDAVEEVVQRNLRLVLGAQFTEKEGERLIARAYNPKLDEKENLKRVTRLIDQIQQAATAKRAAAAYFEKNGTLKGFTGKQWKISDFKPDKEVINTGGWTIEEM